MTPTTLPQIGRMTPARPQYSGAGLILFIGLLLPLVSGCGTRTPKIVTQVDVTELPPGKVPGVNRYCWEQPKVKREANGPGLNADGTYYQPAYTAVREVKQGRWKNCETGEPVKPK
jgi:hypothetical protein